MFDTDAHPNGQTDGRPAEPGESVSEKQTKPEADEDDLSIAEVGFDGAEEPGNTVWAAPMHSARADSSAGGQSVPIAREGRAATD